MSRRILEIPFRGVARGIRFNHLTSYLSGEDGHRVRIDKWH